MSFESKKNFINMVKDLKMQEIHALTNVWLHKDEHIISVVHSAMLFVSY